MSAAAAAFGLALVAALLYTVLRRSVPSYALLLSLGRHWCFWCGSGLHSGQRSLASSAWGSRRTAQPFRA